MASAKDHKERGNAFYTREEFAAAIKCYDAAIALEPASPALFTNRSAAHFASGDYERSLADANAATALDIKWTKGHYRAGAALVELERYDDAIAAYSRGRDADPSNARVKVGLETAERLKREAPADWRDAKSRGRRARPSPARCSGPRLARARTPRSRRRIARAPRARRRRGSALSSTWRPARSR